MTPEKPRPKRGGLRYHPAMRDLLSAAKDWLGRLPDHIHLPDLLVLSPFGVAEALWRFPARAREPQGCLRGTVLAN